MTALQLAVALVLLLGNAFFVGAEFAVVSVRRSQIEPLAEAGNKRARTVLHALSNVSAMLAAAQLGITVCSLGLGALAEPTIAHLLEGPFHALGVPAGLMHPLSYGIALAVVVYLHMVMGEMVPKNMALAGPEKAALWLGPPLDRLARWLAPVIAFLNAFANGVLRLFKVEGKDEVESVFTTEQLIYLLADSGDAGLLAKDRQERLEDALGLGRRPLTEVLLTPEQLVTVDTKVTAAQVEELALRTGFSRFPVTDGDPAGHGYLGYLHLKDILDVDDPSVPVPARLWRPITVLRGTLPLDDALGAMRRATCHLAAVLDQDGRTLGVVMLEDVLEELVGEVHDPDHRSAA
ncbi:hemolysin family protein [Kitasatospora purpeofusca]|uniref:hemolysin family protein n=1 Tax=Kitasatospora purpeofusca TaxID=67352 RepID=UPI002252250D|nr:hemolysin family protein [Kitasatospora purpeofusca]MCX4758546.1 hemolysin family protein [Kitasatospora purpeofusca]WSR31011.1 hemolysin family protein [Kitasatospora purpeofusca]WSR39045.1 hemolysin family protein [Kitasatospora purpeofusca]